MESKQLRYFMAVAEELHFGKAALRLNMSQPPLSQQILKFEEELGVKLFVRSKRSVILTAAGDFLLGEARQILSAMDEAEKRVKAVDSGAQGTLRIGYMTPSLDFGLPAKIKQFRDTWPDVIVSIHELSTPKQIEALKQGHIDAGIVRLTDPDLSGLATRLFHQETYVLAVHADHRLAARKQVALTELEKEPFVFSSIQSQKSLADQWMQAFARAGFFPDIVQTVETKNAAVALVAAGMGISIVPEAQKLRRSKEVKFLAITDEIPVLKTYVAWAEPCTNPALGNFLDLIQ